MEKRTQQDRPAPLGRARVWVMVYFVGVFAAMNWPIYPFFSRIEPLLLGLPFSLFYLVSLLLISFLVLLLFYCWEERRGKE